MSNSSDNVLINSKRVNLNGDESRELDHETFYLDKDYREYNFCKTAQKPYDLVVCSLLLLAHEHMPNHYDIASDGAFNDWQEAMDLNAKLFGYAFKLPPRVDSCEDVAEYESELATRYSKVSSTPAPIVEQKKEITKKTGNRYNM